MDVIGYVKSHKGEVTRSEENAPKKKEAPAETDSDIKLILNSMQNKLLFTLQEDEKIGCLSI